MATPRDDPGITPETVSFRQVARIARWTDQPPSMIGFEHSVCSRRFPILIAPNRRHAQLLCDSLNDRYANQPMMPRFGWLPESDFPAQESVNIATSIRQAQSGKLRGEATTAIHSIAKEAGAVDETVTDSVGPDIMSCDRPQPGRFYVFVRLFPGLLVSSPWKEWVVLPDRDVESVMLSDARKWARENWDKVVAVVQKQSRLRMGTSPPREDEEAVERLLAEAQGRARPDVACTVTTQVTQDETTPLTGRTIGEIATYLDVTEETVRQYLGKAGLPLGERGKAALKYTTQQQLKLVNGILETRCVGSTREHAEALKASLEQDSNAPEMHGKGT